MIWLGLLLSCGLLADKGADAPASSSAGIFSVQDIDGVLSSATEGDGFVFRDGERSVALRVGTPSRVAGVPVELANGATLVWWAPTGGTLSAVWTQGDEEGEVRCHADKAWCTAVLSKLVISR